eukprot:749201-Hanusia_phi.AAC.2
MSEPLCEQIFEVIPPYFANYDLGPGSYVIQDDKEIGKSKSRLQEWQEVADEANKLVQQDYRSSLQLIRFLPLEVCDACTVMMIGMMAIRRWR